MNHFNVILHFFCFTSGIGFIVLSYSFYAKHKSEIMKSIIIADVLFTMILLIDSLQIYIRKNVITNVEILHSIAAIGQFIAGYGLLYYLTSIVSHLTGEKILQNQKKLVLRLLRAAFIVFVTLVILNHLWIINDRYSIYIANSSLCALLIYNISLLLHYFSIMEDRIKIILRKCLAIVFTILPLSIITNIFDFLPLFMVKIPYIPLLYFLLNAVGLAAVRNYIFNDHLKEPKIDCVSLLAEKNETNGVFNKLQDIYHITEREIEIIRYVIEGNSNQDISSKLFISLNTVKNHIYNIYRKIGIKNRYELISLVDKLKQQQP